MIDYEKLGLFYLGRGYDLDARTRRDDPVLYDSRDLVTHAVCVGMTGSGKTGLGIGLLEEAAIDGIPALIVDPKGDLGNLLLTFPSLSAGEFRPWINEDDARRKGLEPDAFAAAEAEKWRRGLAEWQQDGDRIRRLRQAAEAVIYTPGSTAGVPVSVLRSFAAPSGDVQDDPELLRERVATTVTSLLGLAGLPADPIRSREHILLSTILEQAWREGRALDVAALIAAVQAPPVSRVGVLELEAFYPSRDRFDLAMSLNSLLAAPAFAAWIEGEPLDVASLLYTPEGRPRLAVLSIAHLEEAQRMFFVSLLFSQVIGWMRTLSGTTSLRALVYMDEIAGYLPPVASPPSKVPMLTMLKQARAYGVGLVLATQNPVDLDYKALSNAGTWFIGRLQTERDQARVLDGLEGAGGALDRQAMGRQLSALGNRVFLMHNVHESGPTVFETRWALSYLRGPLTRAQIRTLMEARRFTAPATPERPPAPAPASAAAPPDAASNDFVSQAPPVLPPEVPQYFAPVAGPSRLEPMLLGAARVRFTDAKLGADESRDVVRLTPLGHGPVALDWAHAEEAVFGVRDLSREAPAGSRFAAVPAAAQRARSYAEWSRGFGAWLTREQSLTLLRSARYGLVSRPGEDERTFRARLAQAARERRDAEIARVRQKHAPKAAALQERLRRAQQALQKEQEQAAGSKVQTAISFGTTLIGAVLGRRAVSASTLGRATTAARGIGRSRKEAQDVVRAQEAVKAVEAQLQELEASLEHDLGAIEDAHAAVDEPLDPVTLKPKRGGVEVQLVALTWVSRT